MTRRHPVEDEVARYRLAARLDRAVAKVGAGGGSTLVVDLDAFDANAEDLVRRTGGKPIRVASKSLRVPALIRRAHGVPGFAGVMAYSLREALWLVRELGIDDVLMGYPTVDVAALEELASDDACASAVTLMIDDLPHVEMLRALRPSPRRPFRVALDVDAGLQLGSAHVGPKRSPLRRVDQVLEVAEWVLATPGLDLVGVMTYEGQVAGVPDDAPGQPARSAAVRRMKRASVGQLEDRRRELSAALAPMAELQFWNAGGSGSIESSAADPIVTEVTAGSGLLVPHLFDHYRSFVPRPAAFFGVPVVRKPSATTVTVAGGGWIASGAAGKDRAPLPWAPPGLHLTSLEGAGEVQTPLVGPAAGAMEIGDRVWFRHAKSGEPAEHTTEVHLIAGDQVVETVPTYRGLGHAW